MPADTLVRDVVNPYNYIACPPDLNIAKAIELASLPHGGIQPIIIKDNHKMVGILTETDLARLLLKSPQIKHLLIGDIMTQSPYYIESTQTIQACAVLMVEHHIKYLPIKNQTDRIFAVIDIYTVLKILIETI